MINTNLIKVIIGIIVVIATMACIFHNPPNHYYNIVYIFWAVLFLMCCQKELEHLVTDSLTASDTRRLLPCVLIFVAIVEVSSAIHMASNHNYIGMAMACLIATMFIYMAHRAQTTKSAAAPSVA
jgi:uncharacterized membrane protein